MTTTCENLKDHTILNDYQDCCPVHGCECKKEYTFGSSMSAETTVAVFSGCQCAVAVRHDPIGTLDSVVSYHTSYRNASGVGALHFSSAMTSGVFNSPSCQCDLGLIGPDIRWFWAFKANW